MSVQGGDYFATVKIQQGRLISAMKEAGIKNVNELARLTGVAQATLSNMINFKVSPVLRSGEWNKNVIIVCNALGYSPEDLFPVHLHHTAPVNKVSSFIERQQLSGAIPKQIGQCESMEIDDMKNAVSSILDTLSEKEQIVLRARFWDDKTLTQVADDLNLSLERVRQIEAKAFRKLKHPSRSFKLKDVIDIKENTL